jgi:molybdopterin adenylyltransferase
MRGIIRAICISERKGTAKQPVGAAQLVTDHGLLGDAHAGPGHRQVSLLDHADVLAMQQRLPQLAFGAFGENLVVEGLDFSALGLGSVLRVGEQAQLRISQIGKLCHHPCAIFRTTGDCIMPRAGLFARVIAGGPLAVGDVVEVLTLVGRDRIQAVVLTISDTRSRGEAADTSGPAVSQLLAQALQAHLYATEILPDDADVIAGRLRHYCDGHGIDLVVTVGGTGFAPHDVTPEATRAVVERFTPGLDEAMRAAGRQLTPHAILSRGLSGIRGTTLIINLPGAPQAALESLQAILPALEHGLRKLRGDTAPCAAH